MIDAAEYIQLRQRVLIAAEAAHRIASSPHQTVFYDEEMFVMVMDAMLNLKTDIRKLVAECQILRGEISERLVPVMGTVPEPEGQPRSEGTRLHDAGPPVGVPTSGADGAGGSRPKPRGNKGGNRKVQKKLESTGGRKQVDRTA
jgi:hypothetical protein